ncbi:MAG: hypothetical protein IPL61_28380 [Myxococcales bacterium]|nr:hypothetical protein [Myxococcales bacterium]
MFRVVTAFALAAAACGDAGSGPIDAATGVDDAADAAPDAAPEAIATINEAANPDLDLLFVVDNSGTMAAAQAAVAAAIPAMVQRLSTLPGGLPNLHVGVVSTNMGSGGVNIGGCSTASRPLGDNGYLQLNGCPGLTAPFLADLRDAGGGRQRNFTGELAPVLGCMVQLGTTGCGFEQPLEAMFQALQPGKNPGFLRADAMLAVVLVGDEDDCSATDSQLFGDPNGTIASPLGPRTSFRCFEFGVRCDNDPNPRMFGTRTGCVPRAGSPYVQSATRYVDFLRTLKPNASDLVVGGIIGAVDAQRTAVVAADPDDPTRPAVVPSCQGAHGSAYPGFRLATFLDSVLGHTSRSSICDGSYDAALAATAEQVRRAQGDPCIHQPLLDQRPDQPGVQVRCEVTHYTMVGGVRTDPVVLPECVGVPEVCWRIVSDPAACGDVPNAWRLTVDWAGPAPVDALVEARCEAQP